MKINTTQETNEIRHDSECLQGTEWEICVLYNSAKRDKPPNSYTVRRHLSEVRQVAIDAFHHEMGSFNEEIRSCDCTIRVTHLESGKSCTYVIKRKAQIVDELMLVQAVHTVTIPLK